MKLIIFFANQINYESFAVISWPSCHLNNAWLPFPIHHPMAEHSTQRAWWLLDIHRTCKGLQTIKRHLRLSFDGNTSHIMTRVRAYMDGRMCFDRKGCRKLSQSSKVGTTSTVLAIKWVSRADWRLQKFWYNRSIIVDIDVG